MERLDLLNSVHKALRHGMLSLNIEAGRTDYGDAGAVAKLSETWTQLRDSLAAHADHEDTIIFPLLRQRSPGETDGLDADHVRIAALEHGLDDVLAGVVAESDTDKRRRWGREFYRLFQLYTAECLRHFDTEERHLTPRLWALYDDDELRQTFGAVMAKVSPEERQFVMPHMMAALDPVETEAMQRQMAGAG